MSVRNLEHLFRPTSVAVIGASRTPKSIGNQVVANLVEYGYTGPVFPINPKARSIYSGPTSSRAAPRSRRPRGVPVAIRPRSRFCQ